MPDTDILFAYTALAAMPVTFDGITPRVYGLADAPSIVSADLCPMRILKGIGANENEVNMVEFLSAERNAYIAWRVADIFLLRPADSGERASGADYQCQLYAGQYLRAAIAHRYLDDAHQLILQSMTARPGVIEYPREGGAWFHGCICNLTIRETVITV